MGIRPNVRRRWIGGIALGLAIVMLVLGQTLLRNRLPAVWYLVYWAVCLVLTATAMIVALADARDLARGTVREQRDLLENTLKDVEEEARNRRKRKRRWN